MSPSAAIRSSRIPTFSGTRLRSKRKKQRGKRSASSSMTASISSFALPVHQAALGLSALCARFATQASSTLLR